MLEQKVAVVTGASRGIGRAIAEKLAEEGVFVVINYRGNEELPASLLSLESVPGRILPGKSHTYIPPQILRVQNLQSHPQVKTDVCEE